MSSKLANPLSHCKIAWGALRCLTSNCFSCFSFGGTGQPTMDVSQFYFFQPQKTHYGTPRWCIYGMERVLRDTFLLRDTELIKA
ncbi:hypothetical protein NPIL_249041 [Nephila pilipes]|uniref:Uncharacterized protein n=1 Tax=Nephila pilipes TaxID=299642 RepID=A0A8X6UE81_NEPPI|nr:hypothetical protein NPIL_249041 [Nephila pilipes]